MTSVRCVCMVLALIMGSLMAVGQSKAITVRDKSTNEPLIGVNIAYDSKGTTTDQDGAFSLPLLSFPLTISLSYVGYNTLKITFRTSSDIRSDIYMEESSATLDLVTVTGSKYEQNLSKSTVSIDIIKPDLLRSVNAVSSDEILNKVPGVQILDGQANIRGGSGYSYGAGSRVMLLIDDIPALQPDAGFPNWNDIPIENLSQIEILKGAASTLYGSAALNGIINFRSSYAKSEPETRFSVGSVIFNAPKDDAKKWWTKGIRHETNASMVHKQKYGKLDLIASGLYNNLAGYNQSTTESRGRGNLNLRYRYSDQLTFQLGSIVNAGTSSSFFLWNNPGSGAMRPFSGTVSERSAKRIYIDPSITYIDDKFNKHKLMSRTIFINNENNTNQSNASVNQYTEYQFQRNFEKQKMVLTTGVVGSWNKTDSEILGDTTFYANNNAAYIQLDKTIGDKLIIAGGLRYEYVEHKSPSNFQGIIIPDGKAADGQLISRLSGNYALADYTSIRASFGQGYRYPTLTERFVTTTFGSFSIFANPTLKPEFGWTSELGYKQGLRIGGFEGFLDIAAFISEYDDMIEFTFVFEANKLGFQPQNVGNTRIAGYEIGLMGRQLILGIPINLFGGYTYIDPMYKNYGESAQIRNSVSESTNVLKYRSRHQAKMDAEAQFGKFKWGVAVQRVSHVINIDKAFESIPQLNDLDLFGIGQYRDLNNNGYTLLDTRVSATLGKMTITALCNNVLNTEYTLRPALIEAPRNIGLRIDYLMN
ncbi:MAG: TonB-dependent receptor [Saprospiraceae bacterium]